MAAPTSRDRPDVNAPFKRYGRANVRDADSFIRKTHTITATRSGDFSLNFDQDTFGEIRRRAMRYDRNRRPCFRCYKAG